MSKQIKGAKCIQKKLNGKLNKNGPKTGEDVKLIDTCSDDNENKARDKRVKIKLKCKQTDVKNIKRAKGVNNHG